MGSPLRRRQKHVADIEAAPITINNEDEYIPRRRRVAAASYRTMIIVCQRQHCQYVAFAIALVVFLSFMVTIGIFLGEAINNVYLMMEVTSFKEEVAIWSCTKIKPVAHPELRPELLHIPKTGGTTLEVIGAIHNFTWGGCHWAEKNLVDDTGSKICPAQTGPALPKPNHQEAWSDELEFYDYLPPKWNQTYQPWLQNASLFTVVRDPYTKAVSSWNYHNKHKTDLVTNVTAMNDWLNKSITMMHVNRPVDGDKPKKEYFSGLMYFVPQIEWITKDVRVLRTETLKRDFQCMMRGHGYDWKWPKKEVFNKSKRPNRLTVANLTSATKSLIAKAYREDFEQLGYQYHVEVET